MKIVGDTLEFKTVPQTAWRIGSGVFVLLLLAVGVFVFAKLGASWSSFWIVWFGFISLVGAALTISQRIVISKRKGNVIRVFSVVGLIPLLRQSRELQEFQHVTWSIKRDRLSDDAAGVYVPTISLTDRRGGKIVLQVFSGSRSRNHPESEKNAAKIAHFMGLTLEQEVDP